MDVHLPDADGFELTVRLGDLADPPTVVLTSSRDGAELERCVSECGACGFVPKAELSRETIEDLLPMTSLRRALSRWAPWGSWPARCRWRSRWPTRAVTSAS